MKNADEWAIALGNRIKTGKQEAQEREQTVAMKRQIIAEKMPGIWAELMSLFQSHCEAHNRNNSPPRALSCHQMKADTFLVSPDALPEIVTVHLSRNTNEIMIKTPSGAQRYVLRAAMRDDGDVDVEERSSQRIMSLPEIVEKALTDAILRGRIDY